MKFREIREGWRDLAGTSLGMASGYAAFFPLSSLFFRALEHEFGWSKSATAASLIVLPLTAICLPIAGRLLDRFGVRRVALISALSLACCFVWLSRMNGSLPNFYAASLALTVLGCATSSISYTRTLVVRFPAARGRALATALLGVSLSAMALPAFIALVVANGGWRAGYLAFAAIASIGGAVACALIRPSRDHGKRRPVDVVADGSLTPKQAVRTARFWLLGWAIFAIGFGGLGFVSQLQSIVIDRGISPERAPVMLSWLALSVFLGRLIVGVGLDRSTPHRVAAMTIATAGAGLAVMLVPQASPVIACLLVGFGVGAEMDILSFFCAREFGVGYYGSIYGLLSSFFYAGFASGGLFYAQVYDWTGSYQDALGAGAVIMLVAAVLLLLLGPTRARRGVLEVARPVPSPVGA